MALNLSIGATQPNVGTPCGRSGSRAALVNEAP